MIPVKWFPGRVGITGNGHIDSLAKEGTMVPGRFDVHLQVPQIPSNLPCDHETVYSFS